MIAQIIPGYEAIGDIDADASRSSTIAGPHLPRAALRDADRQGAASRACRCPPLRGDDGQLRLMTVRSEGQFNTVVYEEEDIYRGQERRDVILMNRADIDRLGLAGRSARDGPQRRRARCRTSWCARSTSAPATPLMYYPGGERAGADDGRSRIEDAGVQVGACQGFAWSYHVEPHMITGAMFSTRSHPMRILVASLAIILATHPIVAQEPAIKVQETDDYIQIDTDALQAQDPQEGLRQRHRRAAASSTRRPAPATLGFGLHIMDFLLGPGWQGRRATRANRNIHGDLPKHYVEGPQICTQAKELKPEIIRGKDFVAVRMQFRFTKPGTTASRPARPGSRRSSSSPACATSSPQRSDHQRQRRGRPVLSHRHARPRQAQGRRHLRAGLPELPRQADPRARSSPRTSPPTRSSSISARTTRCPSGMIRAYQVEAGRQAGPVAGGHDARPGRHVSEAWCHQRGYVCFIQELHGHKVKAGETFGAAYVVGWFDDVPAMQRIADQFDGKQAIELEGKKWRLR